MENQEQYYLNDYQMNKACPDAIVYPDENGNPVKYTADSFASQEEFKRWKKWSDRSYADIESANRKEERNCVSLFEQDAPTPSAEETIIERADRIKESIIQRELIRRFLSILTELEERRFLMRYEGGMTLKEIAMYEDRAYSSVKESIDSANKKICRFKCKLSVKTPAIFGDFLVLSEGGHFRARRTRYFENQINSVKGTKPA